jgi:hypothetical protein
VGLKMSKLIFDEGSIPLVLEALGCAIDKDGYVINAKTKNYCLDVWGDRFLAKDFKHAIWEGSHKGYWHLYGHSHSSAEHWEIGKSMDVGVDNAYRLLGEYRPFSLEEVGKFMSQREIHNVDHHDKNTNVR